MTTSMPSYNPKHKRSHISKNWSKNNSYVTLGDIIGDILLSPFVLTAGILILPIFLIIRSFNLVCNIFPSIAGKKKHTLTSQSISQLQVENIESEVLVKQSEFEVEDIDIQAQNSEKQTSDENQIHDRL